MDSFLELLLANFFVVNFWIVSKNAAFLDKFQACLFKKLLFMLNKPMILALVHLFDAFAKVFVSHDIFLNHIIKLIFFFIELICFGLQLVVLYKDIQ